MPEPLTPTDYVNIGGVRFNSNDIKQKQTLINDNGAIRYSVFLKNGVHLEYPKQDVRNNASVTHVDQDKLETATWINNLAYGQVKGTEKSDHIVLHGNNGTTVDVTGDDRNVLGDIVSIRDSEKGRYNGCYLKNNKFTPSQNNKVIAGKLDYIGIDTQYTKVVIEGAGITTEKSLKGVKEEE